jgi:hypothetical protein
MWTREACYAYLVVLLAAEIGLIIMGVLLVLLVLWLLPLVILLRVRNMQALSSSKVVIIS